MSVVELPRIGEWEKKCWGLTRCISHNDHHSAHELRTLAGWQCSLHRHQQRANSFFVDSGVIEVRLFGDDRRDGVGYRVGPGKTFDVPSGVWHRFAVIESGTVFETYWPDRGGVVLLDDIERDPDDLGGRV